MNEQKPPNAIEWTRIRNPDGTIRRGYTWNPIAGCLHDCEWIVNGQRAECYAKTVAEKFIAAYPDGFASYYWHPKRVLEPKAIKEGAGIFPDSMSDLFGNWIQEDHVHQIFDVMRDTPQHIYQALTKDAPRYLKFNHAIPANMWLGVSSPPDHMLGTDLNQQQKERYLHKALSTLSQFDQRVTWMSFEPLSQDLAGTVAQYPTALKWAVIGAASNGNHYYPPEEKHVRNLLEVLDRHSVPVFFKGNLHSLPWAAANWREQFPGEKVTILEPVEIMRQMSMFEEPKRRYE